MRRRNTMNIDGYLTRDAYIKMRGICDKTEFVERKNDRGPHHYVINRMIYYKHDEVIKWLESQRWDIQSKKKRK